MFKHVSTNKIRNKVRMLKKSRARSEVMIATSLAHFANDVPVTLLSAVLPIVIKEFGLNYAAAGALLTSFVFLMTSMQAIPGYVADRANRIALLFLGLTTLGAGAILVSYSSDYVQLLASQCLMGIGASVYHPVGYSLLSDVFEPGQRGKALGLGSAAGDMAIPVAFVTSGFLVLILGWRDIFRLWGVFAIAIALTMPFIMAEPKQRSLHSSVASRPARDIVVTLTPIIIVMSFAGAIYRITSSFTTTYLTTLGLSIESADAVTALMMVVGAFGSVVGGTLTDRIGERKTVCLTMAMLTVLSLVSVNVGDAYLLSPLICLIGFTMLSVWPSFYSAIASATSLGARAFAYGILFAISWSFGSLFPYVTGACADIFGLKIIYVFVSVLSLLAAVIAYLTLKDNRTVVMQ